MPSDIYARLSSGWSTPVKKIYAKTETGWSAAIRFVHAFLGAGYVRVWPLSGIYATTNPWISTTGSSTELPYGTVLRVGTTYRGNRGTFNPNGYVISSYQYKWVAYTYLDISETTKNYNPTLAPLSGTTNDFTLTGTTSANYDRGYVTFFVKAKASGGAAYDGEAESLRYYVVRQKPIISSNGQLSNLTPTVGNTINYSSGWNITDPYKIESGRSTIKWYRSTSSTLTASQLKSGSAGSPIQDSTSSPPPASPYSYTTTSSDLDNYIYAIEEVFNSGTDYELGTTNGSTEVAKTTSVVASAKLATPTNVTASDNRADGINITWTAVSGAAYYGIWYGPTPSYDSTPDFQNITGTSYLDDSVGAGVTRDYYVQAFRSGNPAGTKSDWGGPDSGTRILQNLTTTPAYGSSTSTGGGWTASISTQPNPTGGTYSVVSQTAGSASVNSSTGALTASGLSVGASSTVTVRYSLSGYNTVDITANGSALSKLATPSGVNATDTRTDGINVTWNAVSGAAYYGVWYGSTPSYDSTPDFQNITGTSYLDDSMGAGVTRNYYVQAFRSGNPAGTKSDWGGPDSGTRAIPNLITNPAYGAATRVSGGWSATISTAPNPTGGTYSVVSQTAGSASVNSSTGALTASGLNAGQSSTVTIQYNRSGYNPVNITANGQALSNLTTNPAYGTATPTTGGWSATISTAPNPTGGTYSVVSQTAGSASVNSSTGALSASGLGNGASSTVTVRYSLSGYNSVNITASGTSSTVQYTVTWNANGGSVSPTSNTVNAGSSVTAPTPTRSGFTFLYWRDSPSADFLYSVNAGGSFTPPSSITMYARWQSAATTPGPVQSLSATSSLSGTNLNWSASWSAPANNGGSAITGYRVYVERGSSSTGPWSAATTRIPATTTTPTYTAASPFFTTSTSVTSGRVINTSSTWIRVFVAAVNSVGTGSYTTAVG